MTHPLRNNLAIDVDDMAGIGNIGGVRVENRPIMVVFCEAFGTGGFANRATVKEIDTWRSPAWAANGQRRLYGLRFVPSGWGYVDETPGSGSRAAKKFSDAITALEADGKRRIDVVEWDVETHNMAWQKEFLLGGVSPATKGIRGAGGKLPNPKDRSTLGYRWGRPGVWTMEGRQGANGCAAHLAAKTGLWVGPQIYGGGMEPPGWSYQYEIRTWVLGTNPEKNCPPQDMLVPIEQFIPYTDARRWDSVHNGTRPEGEAETVLFATSRLTELVAPP